MTKGTGTVWRWLLLLVSMLTSVVGNDFSRRCPWITIAFASSLTPPIIPPPPPISVPVWSLASPITTKPPPSTSEKETSMNIVTFSTPVSVEPPKLWVVSLYYDTLTRQAMIDSGVGVLQLLSPEQKHLVPLLGKQSGYQAGISKRSDCESLGFKWIKGGGRANDQDDWPLFLSPDDSDVASLDLLPNCVSYVRLKLLSTTPAGDHEVALCQVEDTGIWDEATQQVVVSKGTQPPIDASTALYTGQLREEGII